MSDFLKSNPALDHAIAECTNAEQIREITKASLVASGVIARDPETQGYGVTRLQSHEPTPAASLPATPAPAATCTRVVYPSGNNRFELFGASEAELDEKESQIRQMYGGQR